jgi:predicted acyl esterase
MGIKVRGGSEAARRGQHLLVTIGGHAGSGRKIGDVDFGPAAAEFDENEITLKWYDYLFKGVQNEFAGKPVKIFVMGANQWREEGRLAVDPRPKHKIFSALDQERELAARGRKSLHRISAFGNCRPLCV